MAWFLFGLAITGLAGQDLPAKATPTEAPGPKWIERFEGGSLKDLGWEGGGLEDGKIDHFLVHEGGNTFLRSRYIVGTEAKYLRKTVEWDAHAFPWLRWRWRVQKFPLKAKILDADLSDAPAQIYLLWRHFPIYYVIKYFWATSEKVGTLLEQSSLFFGQLHGEIVRSGGVAGEWHTETRNVYEDFQRAFHRDPPGNLRGIAVLSDGDETKSESEADYDDFEIFPEGSRFTPASSAPAPP